MKAIDFALKSMFRRKAETTLNVVLISMVVNSTLFILNFLFNLSFKSTRLFFSIGILNTLKQYILFLAALTVLYCILIIHRVSTTLITLKYKDIGLMKAIGGDTDLINTCILLEIFFTILLSFFFSIILLFPLNIVMAKFYSSLIYTLFPSMNPLLILALFTIIFLFSYIFSQKEINRAIDLETAKTFVIEQSGESIRELSLFNRFFARFSSSLKIAAKSLERNRRKFGKVSSTLLIVFLFLTLYFYGGFLVKFTLMSYVEEAYGKEVIAIGHPQLLDKYSDLIKSFKEEHVEKIDFDFLEESYLISKNCIDAFSEIEGIETIDTRLIYAAVVQERPYIEIAEYRQIGDHRKAEALILGVNMDQLVSRWYIEGELLENNDTNTVMIGDSLAYTIFEDPFRQSMYILPFKKVFKIKSVAVDPLNNGFTVYMPLNTLQKLIQIKNVNLILLKVKNKNVFKNIEKIAEEFNLSVKILSDIIISCLDAFSKVWTYFEVPVILIIVSSLISMVTYISLTLTDSKMDFWIMRALGVKWRKILSIAIGEYLILLNKAMIIGVYLGFFISFFFLIPNPTFPTLDVTLTLFVIITIYYLLTIMSNMFFLKKQVLELFRI